MCSIQDYKEGSGYLSFEHVSKIFMEGPEPYSGPGMRDRRKYLDRDKMYQRSGA